MNHNAVVIGVTDDPLEVCNWTDSSKLFLRGRLTFTLQVAQSLHEGCLQVGVTTLDKAGSFGQGPCPAEALICQHCQELKEWVNQAWKELLMVQQNVHFSSIWAKTSKNWGKKNTDIYRKINLSKGNSNCEGFEAGTCLVWLKNHREPGWLE